MKGSSMSAWPPAAPSATSRRRLAALVLALPGALDGCATAPGRDQPPQPAVQTLPAGAVAVGPDLYQVPIGEDSSGCTMYRLYSPGRLVSQGIAWRSRGGGFTSDRSAADCAG
jgi:hypothetical protein